MVERSRILIEQKVRIAGRTKKLGDILTNTWRKNIESFLEVIFVWSRSSLVFWVPLAKNIDSHVSLYILYIHYIYIHMPSWLVFSSQLPMFSLWSRSFFKDHEPENQPMLGWWFMLMVEKVISFAQSSDFFCLKTWNLEPQNGTKYP